MKLISVQIGQPRERVTAVEDGVDKTWVSSIWKSPVEGRVRLEREDLAGNAQADVKNHGGPDKAVCCYAADHYPGWRQALGKSESEFPFGAFGENFTLFGQSEEDAVCLGDVYAVGTARVQVSQPRVPCWKLGRRWNLPRLPGDVSASGKTGYYFRVLEPGDVGAGDTVTLQERPLPQWPVARLNRAMYEDKDDLALAAELSHLPLLADAWRGYFRRRLGEKPS